MHKLTEKEIVDKIKNCIKLRSETGDVELKDARGGIPNDLWKSISSFSNSQDGGLIILGVQENRSTNNIEVVGVGNNAAQKQEQLLSYFVDNMMNHKTPYITIFEMEGVTLIAAQILEVEQENKPCFKRQIGLPKGACQRVGTSDKAMDMEKLKNMLRNSSSFNVDRKDSNDLISDLDLKKVKEFFESSAKRTGRRNDGDINAMMRAQNILTKKTGTATLAGVLVFSKEGPQSKDKYSRLKIRCVRYAGVSAASPIVDKLDVEGTLDTQIDNCHTFLLRNIPTIASIEGVKRVESYVYSSDALRELVANAIIHRDYFITNTYTHIQIFSNRIEISNPGNLPPGVTIDNIKDAQFSRNEVIAGILSDMLYLEEYGRGIDIVLAESKRMGLYKPFFENSTNSFKVTVFGPAFSLLTDRQMDIWKNLKKVDRITTKEVMDLFGVSRATAVSDINILISEGLAISEGASSSTHYTLKD